jgi:hypothetical protein
MKLARAITPLHRFSASNNAKFYEHLDRRSVCCSETLSSCIGRIQTNLKTGMPNCTPQFATLTPSRVPC